MTGTREALEQLRSTLAEVLRFDDASRWPDDELLAAAGGCLIPGCSVPAAWCEIHHVTPAADGGPTRPDNGVMLCWFHHRTIDTSGWGIRMLRGVPQIRPPVWLDPGGGWRAVTKSPTRIADRHERHARHDRRGRHERRDGHERSDDPAA